MKVAPTPLHELSFSIDSLSAWAPGVSTAEEWQEWSRGDLEIGAEGEPPLRQMPAMMRRHAGRLGKLVCEVAYDSTGAATGIPIVFSSRYGDVQRSVDLLDALAAGGELSPTSFGLSVHNASVGLLAMARKDSANSVALAAGDEAAEYGILEACGLIDDGAERVLVIVADCPLPAVYSMFAGVHPVTVPFAWACVVRPAGADESLRLEWEDGSGEIVVEEEPPGGLAVLRFLESGDRELVRVAGDRLWRWRRHIS